LTPTEGPSPTPTQSPTATPTPAPTNTPTPGPSATPGPGPTSTPGQGPTSTSGPQPTSTPGAGGIGGGEITNPSVLGVAVAASPTLPVQKNVNPSVRGIKKSGQILGAKTKRLAKTGNTTFTSAPTDNDAITGEHLYIPALNLTKQIYKGETVNGEMLIGSNEVLKSNHSSSTVLYGHNTQQVFGGLWNVKIGKPVFYTRDGKTVEYTVKSVAKVYDTTTEVLESTNPRELTLITCDPYNASIRYVITAAY